MFIDSNAISIPLIPPAFIHRIGKAIIRLIVIIIPFAASVNATLRSPASIVYKMIKIAAIIVAVSKVKKDELI